METLSPRTRHRFYRRRRAVALARAGRAFAAAMAIPPPEHDAPVPANG
ncbi:hypothetical protein [Actinoplanes utahensis]|nr:hypothetical protein [Actinoplanes utahensis]